MRRNVDDYSDFVEHPRYGRGPRFTDIRPGDVPLGYRLATSISDPRIGGTAVEADLERQAFSPVPVLYYFDLERKCVDCGRAFIFFAEEQQHWYETLGFDLSANCIRCTDCRNRQHGLERQRRRYEELFQRESRTVDETLEMADCSLALIEGGAFHVRQAERIRMLLNTLPDTRDEPTERRFNDIRQRVIRIETAQSRGRAHAPRDSNGESSPPSP
jgi:hypothetical protein